MKEDTKKKVGNSILLPTSLYHKTLLALLIFLTEKNLSQNDLVILSTQELALLEEPAETQKRLFS